MTDVEEEENRMSLKYSSQKLKLDIPCSKRNFFERIFNWEPTHEWQTRAQNRFGLSTYEVCLKCGKAQERNDRGKSPEFIECERIAEFDDQFDENGKYIYTIIINKSYETKSN